MTDTPPILTAKQKQLVRESFEVALDYSTSLTKLFYGRLFELDPIVRRVFPERLDEQSRKLLDMLATIIQSLDRFEDIRPQLADLGRKHVTYGARPGDYELVRVALLWALAHALEGVFDRETRAAWDQMLRTITAAMTEPLES